jgi:hypothetical protein
MKSEGEAVRAVPFHPLVSVGHCAQVLWVQ